MPIELVFVHDNRIECFNFICPTIWPSISSANFISFFLSFSSLLSFIHSFIYMNRSYDTLQCNLIGSHVCIVDMIDITLICRKLPHQCPTRLLYIQLTMNTVQLQTLCSMEIKKKKTYKKITKIFLISKLCNFIHWVFTLLFWKIRRSIIVLNGKEGTERTLNNEKVIHSIDEATNKYCSNGENCMAEAHALQWFINEYTIVQCALSAHYDHCMDFNFEIDFDWTCWTGSYSFAVVVVVVVVCQLLGCFWWWFR